MVVGFDDTRQHAHERSLLPWPTRPTCHHLPARAPSLGSIRTQIADDEETLLRACQSDVPALRTLEEGGWPAADERDDDIVGFAALAAVQRAHLHLVGLFEVASTATSQHPGQCPLLVAIGSQNQHLAAVVGDDIIKALRDAVVDEETVEIRTQIEVGTEVQVLKGAFSGIRALVTQVLPAQARVKVLLELLGMEREVEIEESGVLPHIAHPLTPN